MNAMRTLLSALSIVVGVALIAGWALANAIVTLVEDGTAVRSMTSRALDTPALTDVLANDLSSRTGAALRDQGINLTALGLDGQLDEAFSRAVDSQSFRSALTNQVDEAHGQFSDQLTDSTRGPAPLTVSVNFSGLINDRVDQLGGPAALLPDVNVPPVDLQVLEAERFEQVREAYGTVLTVHTWGLWLGLGALALGMLVSHRKRWFVAKALFGVAALTLGLSGVVTVLGPEAFARFLPGGTDGVWSSLWHDVVGAEAAEIVAERSLIVGVVALVGALIAVGVGAAVGDRRR